jgi:hypothetical protein
LLLPELKGPKSHSFPSSSDSRKQSDDLGTLGEDFSAAAALNNRGQVVGLSLNGIPDPVSPFFNPTESLAFLSQDGNAGFGTLGGVDAGAFAVNESRAGGGISSTNTTPTIQLDCQRFILSFGNAAR